MSDTVKIVKALQKKYSTEAARSKDKNELQVFQLSDADSPCVVDEYFTTGCIPLDFIMGNGLPVGRMTEFYGDPSSGKSLIAASIAAQAQQQYKDIIIVYVDTENAVSLELMSIIGVDTSNVIYSSPDTVEETFTLFDDVLDAKDPDVPALLIWDSVAATSSEQEMKNAYGKATMGRGAQLISASLRKFCRRLSKNRAAALFLNQTRQKIGVMFGDDTATFGGKAIPFHATVRVELNLSGKIRIPGKTKGKYRIVGMYTDAVCVKNKVGIPFKHATLPIQFGHGISIAESAWDFLKDNGLMEPKGSTGRFDLTLGEYQYTLKQAEFEDGYNDIADEVRDLILSSEQETGEEVEEKNEDPEE